jgi:hypothetical protein
MRFKTHLLTQLATEIGTGNEPGIMCIRISKQQWHGPESVMITLDYKMDYQVKSFLGHGSQNMSQMKFEANKGVSRFVVIQHSGEFYEPYK